MATAFVGGATGYTGREVVRALVSRGVRTVAHVRPNSPHLEDLTRQFAAEGAEVDSTQWDDAALAQTFAELRPTLVFALLGTTRERAKRAEKTESGAGAAETYDAVDYALTAKLLRAATPVGAKFVYLSALGAGSPSSAYYAARFKAEAEIRESGLPYVIARPAFITGPDRPEPRPGERIGAAALDGVLSLAALVGARNLQARFGSMSAKELGGALVALGLSASEVRSVAEPKKLRDALAW
jgi:uncharacterized protein YbjT (DUF2867 family)